VRDRGAHRTGDIFEFFRDLNVFKREKKRFELKVVAVLLYAFGLSLHEGRPLASSGCSLSPSRSRVFRIR